MYSFPPCFSISLNGFTKTDDVWFRQTGVSAPRIVDTTRRLLFRTPPRGDVTRDKTRDLFCRHLSYLCQGESSSSIKFLSFSILLIYVSYSPQLSTILLFASSYFPVSHYSSTMNPSPLWLRSTSSTRTSTDPRRDPTSLSFITDRILVYEAPVSGVWVDCRLERS